MRGALREVCSGLHGPRCSARGTCLRGRRGYNARMRHAARVVSAFLALAVLAGCPSKDTPPPATTADAGALPDPKVDAAAAELKALAEQVRTTCEAEFQRIATEQLVPGEPTMDCVLGEKDRLQVKLPTVRPSLGELPSGTAVLCHDLQQELDLAVKQSGPDNPRRSEAAIRVMLEGYRKVVLVGVVSDKRVDPVLKLNADGKPEAFTPGLLGGVGYLYSVRDGKLLCAIQGVAENTDHAKELKTQQVGDEAAANLDLADDLEASFVKSLMSSARYGLMKASEKPAQKPAPKKTK
jgi:hypothetical protein